MKSTQLQIMNFHSKQLKPTEKNVTEDCSSDYSLRKSALKKTNGSLYISIILKQVPKSESPAQPFLLKIRRYIFEADESFTHNHRTYLSEWCLQMSGLKSWLISVDGAVVCVYVLFLAVVFFRTRQNHMLHVVWNIYIYNLP